MFFVSLSLVLAAVVSVAVFGLNLGVDFKGGTVLELQFSGTRPDTGDITAVLTGLGNDALKEATVNSVGTDSVVIRTSPLDEATHQNILAALNEKFPDAGLHELRFDSVGPAIGTELRNRSIQAIIIVLAGIILYIALVFRSMRRTLSPWYLSVAAIIALLHDVIIPIGVFALLGHVAGIQITAVFVAAILTILGYSVSDTVVVFDRIRENVIRGARDDFAVIMHRSVIQTLVRSLNTTLTTLLSLAAIYIFGGESIKYFALALIIGIGLGAYSSIFVASPLLVWLSRRSRRS